MDDDGPILRQFVTARSPEAFAHVVGRHVHLVYSACVRQLKDPTLADQATQGVFVLLAREAPSLTEVASLVPWLFDASHRVCDVARRHASGDAPASSVYAAPSDWTNLAPRIDDAIADLPDDVREAFLLKYVANLPLREVAAAQGVPDVRAGQRIADGVTRLRRSFESANLFLAPDALVAAIQSRAIQAAPVSVGYNATTAALSPPAPTPAFALADAAVSARRRERWVSVVSAVCVLLILGLAVMKLQSVMRAAAVAATRPATQNADVATTAPPPTPRPEPTLPPMPERVPVPKPPKPVDAELAARFIAAVRQSDPEMVAQLVDRDEEVINAKDAKTGRSAVQIAADLVLWNKQDATRIAHFLIDAGAETDIHTAARAGHRNYVIARLLRNPKLIDAKDAEGLTPLQRAALVPGASPECEEVADLLIQAGATVDVWTACTLGRLTDVQQALADDPAVVDKPCLGATPLNWATRPRRYADDPIAIPKLLVEHKADPRRRDTANDGMTPLHHAAAWGGQAAVAAYLIDAAHVDANVLDDYGWTPLDYAIDRSRKEMVAFFESKGGRRTTQHYPDRPTKTARFYAAVQSSDVDLVHRLLDDTPELAIARGPTGETPLHWAAARGSIPIIELLLADKADPNAQETNKYGGTPLHWAVRNDQPETVKHLLGKGADAKAVNARSGQTLLHVAAQHTDDAGLVGQLLAAGIDPTVRDRFGKTAADYAREGAHGNVAARLASVGR